MPTSSNNSILENNSSKLEAMKVDDSNNSKIDNDDTEDDNSDIDIVGIDQEGDEEAAEEEDEEEEEVDNGMNENGNKGSNNNDDSKNNSNNNNNNNNNNNSSGNGSDEKKEEEDNLKLANEELEEARKERMELMAAEKQQIMAQYNDDQDPESKLQYLLAQSEVFAHFLAGSVATGKKKGKGGRKTGNRGKTGRMTEAEEDAQLLKSAQSKRRTVRLNKQPSNLASFCKMHAYQLEGLNWLIKLHDNGINGILADEMGLGKTLQTISLLAYLRESRGVKGPHIVVVPKSVLGNWIREIKKWCPCIKTLRMGGSKGERVKSLPLLKANPLTFDVLVTSYEGLLKEKSILSKIQWKYLIIDEAHRIKNENSSLSNAVRLIQTDFRLLITGTPLQNNLHELWALLNFLLPDIFGDAEQFDEWFSLSGNRGQENVIRKLHTVLRPFMIRRVKKDVACALPPKKETKLYVGLTNMQQEWYKRILRKDAHALNSLGGPDRVRLLNILMQLRKVCNHPYLFDGAEKGPPYTDGPHLWENSGKMLLLHKLLTKLKKKGSRVLIFTQMTRVLDIMEDYLRLMKYDYCRIDGNTDGELRDSQMEDFNSPNSSKFIFLLSTRAGGLGINLATADIVILYDSDWNPQVDLQAMDRAHRIGQKKPVQVFRFVSEGTVEEKIIERADRKLFLDAAVIQQGRLAEQHTAAGKDDLMKMVRFGADQILTGTEGTYTDEDIDALIARGEERTDAIKDKLQTDCQHNLASFTLLGEDETGHDTFDFGGENYRDADKKKTGNFINLPQRERKRNYDVNEYFRDAMNTSGSNEMKAHAADAAAKKRRKGHNYQDFQLYNKERMEAISQRERDLAAQKEQELEMINDLRVKVKRVLAAGSHVTTEGDKCETLLAEADRLEKNLNDTAAFSLTPEEIAEKDNLLAEGFPEWSKKDFKAFCSSLERYGRYNLLNVIKDVVSETGKEESEIKRYYISFWLNYRRITEWKKIIDKIEKGEKKILRLRQIRDAIQELVERHIDEKYGDLYAKGAVDGKPLPPLNQLLNYCWQTMTFNYGIGQKSRAYSDQEDGFLICMMHRHGYGAAERIRMEIRRAWQFRFNWYFKSRNAQDIQKRCDILVKVVMKENDDARKKEEQEEMKRLMEDQLEARKDHFFQPASSKAPTGSEMPPPRDNSQPGDKFQSLTDSSNAPKPVVDIVMKDPMPIHTKPAISEKSS